MSSNEFREFDERIQAQIRRFLREVAWIFLVLGGIVLLGWAMASQKTSVFKIRSDLMDTGRFPLFDVLAVKAFPAGLALVRIERTPTSGRDRAWAAEWAGPSGVGIKFWRLDSFGLNPKRSELSGMDPGARAKELFDSLSGSLCRGGCVLEPEAKARDFQAVRLDGPGSEVVHVMRAGETVGLWRRPDMIDFVGALEFAHRVGLIEPPVVPIGGWNRLRLNLDLWAAGFAVLAACLWMWQILTSGTRAARFEPAKDRSEEPQVAEGLQTLSGLHPAIGLEKSGDGFWIVRFDMTSSGRFLQQSESAEIRHEIRIRLHHGKAIVVESIKSKGRTSEANSLSRGSERSRILPMISIPRGPLLPLKPSLEGFLLQMDSIGPEDLRYALVVFFLLHGWGWEPRLF